MTLLENLREALAFIERSNLPQPDEVEADHVSLTLRWGDGQDAIVRRTCVSEGNAWCRESVVSEYMDEQEAASELAKWEVE